MSHIKNLDVVRHVHHAAEQFGALAFDAGKLFVEFGAGFILPHGLAQFRFGACEFFEFGL